MSDHARFTEETAPHRRELRAYCYRMAGAASDAEDLVQETYLRAWRAYPSFERRASVRSWLYAIATNVCSTARHTRRALPSMLGVAYDGARPPTAIADAAWIEPVPDEWIDPASATIERESVRLALIASLQSLPSRQRAILILREMLSFSAAETAEMLGTTVAAVKSGLQRARARVAELAPDRETLLEPTDPRARALLDGYIAAFEHADASLLRDVLRADATLEATPFRDWAAGRARCIELLSWVLGTPGEWAMSPTIANGQPAAIVRRRVEGEMRLDGVVVIDATATGIARVVAFHHDPSLAERFGQRTSA